MTVHLFKQVFLEEKYFNIYNNNEVITQTQKYVLFSISQ